MCKLLDCFHHLFHFLTSLKLCTFFSQDELLKIRNRLKHGKLLFPHRDFPLLLLWKNLHHVGCVAVCHGTTESNNIILLLLSESKSMTYSNPQLQNYRVKSCVLQAFSISQNYHKLCCYHSLPRIYKVSLFLLECSFTYLIR